MPATIDKKRAELQRQAELAVAFRALVNGVGFPNKASYAENSDFDKGTLSYHYSKRASIQPTYTEGMKARAHKKGAEDSSSLTPEQAIEDSRRTGMLTTRGLLTLIDCLSNSSGSPLSLKVTAVNKRGDSMQVFTYGDSPTVIALNHKVDHYYPEGMKYEDITTHDYTCAFASILVWMEKNDELDRLQPLIDQGKEAGVDQSHLSKLQDFVVQEDFSATDKDKEALVPYKEFDDYKKDYLKEVKDKDFNYEGLVETCMKVAGESLPSDQGAKLSQMSMFVKKQDQLLKHYADKKVPDTSSDDASKDPEGRSRSSTSSSEDSLGMD